MRSFLLHLSRLRERSHRIEDAMRVRALSSRGFSIVETPSLIADALCIGVLLKNGGRRPPVPLPQAGEGEHRRSWIEPDPNSSHLTAKRPAECPPRSRPPAPCW